MIKKIIQHLPLIRKIFNTFLYLLTPTHKCVLINAWVKQFGQIMLPFNYGDDINLVLVQELTGKKVFSIKELLYIPNKENYMLIGSILDYMSTTHSVVWGAGAIYGGDYKMSVFPKKIVSVRGKYTMNYLKEQGIKCQNLFGDPALLLPYIYTPEKKKHYKFGVIPHVIDIEEKKLAELINFIGPNSIIIKLNDYKRWQDIIDLICSCDFIISSSLHGIIISDAYQIPNIAIKISDRLVGGDFKFMDYCSSIDRPFVRFELSSLFDNNFLTEAKSCYKCINFDSAFYLKTAPFEILPKYRVKK